MTRHWVHIMKQTIEVREANPNAQDALALLMAGHKAMQSEFPDKKQHEFSIEALTSDRVKVILAYLDGVPAGCCAIFLETGYAELKKLFVVPKARGHGIAEMLIQHSEDLARAHRYGKLMLESGVGLHAAHRLYCRLGYKQRGVFGTHKALGDSMFFERSITI